MIGCFQQMGDSMRTMQLAVLVLAGFFLTACVEETGGLQIKTLNEGTGAVAQIGDTAVVHYTGWLYDDTIADKRGTKFDSSRDRNQLFRFALGEGRVIQGWDQGVTGMQVGEVRQLTIPPNLGYGARGAGNVIPPNATLIFEVELVGLE